MAPHEEPYPFILTLEDVVYALLKSINYNMTFKILAEILFCQDQQIRTARQYQLY